MAKSNSSTGATTSLPLFYKEPTALDAKKHGKTALKTDPDYSFTQEVNAVPINLVEMPQICHFYPIAFSGDGSATPVALLGLRNNENLFVDKKGNWLMNTYIPSYIRRYPFIFAENPDNKQLTLCVDMKAASISEKGKDTFFDKDGKPTQLAQNALEFCKSYQSAAQQTQPFSEALAKSGLLVDRQAELTVKGGRKITFSGFKVIDEQKLAEMSDKDFLEWRKKGWLPFLYAHLFSGANWQRLTSLMNERLEDKAA
ncbi:MAG: sapC family protein [Micavibrio sp.]|nr:sapC family protein [Micavibrio sp.]|tara:strand:+ start:2196 stop:2963 length:768 start_codon:yes stop_codon:yes gene_type:complete